MKSRRGKKTFCFDKEHNVEAYFRAVVVEPLCHNKRLERA